MTSPIKMRPVRANRNFWPVKPFKAWVITNEFGRVYVSGEVWTDYFYRYRSDALAALKMFAAPHLWRIASVEIKEITRKKKQ